MHVSLLDWTFEPGEVIGLAVASLWYAAGVRAMWRRAKPGHGVRRWQAWSYAAGIATLAVALMSPIDAAAEQIFAAHMVQHLLLIVVAAPLMVLGAPAPALWWGIPPRMRRAVARTWLRSRGLQRTWHTCTAPGLVVAAHIVALWFWHFPAPYQLALRNDAVHAAEHLSFLGTAVLFWWVVLQPAGARRLSHPATLIAIVVTLVQSAALGAFLVYARTPWYPAHAAGARAWGLTPLEDQQLAGIIMWIPAGVAYLAAAVWTFVEWMAWDERRARSADAARRAARSRPTADGSALRALTVVLIGALASSVATRLGVGARGTESSAVVARAAAGSASTRPCGGCVRLSSLR